MKVELVQMPLRKGIKIDSDIGVNGRATTNCEVHAVLYRVLSRLFPSFCVSALKILAVLHDTLSAI
jgi:hypothetical protein